MGRSKRVLVLVQGKLGENLIGPEIRGWEMVRALSAQHEVTAAADVERTTIREGVTVVPRTRVGILAALRDHDAVIGPVIPPYAFAGRAHCLRVSDLYDPVELELGTLEGRPHSAKSAPSAPSAACSCAGRTSSSAPTSASARGSKANLTASDGGCGLMS